MIKSIFRSDIERLRQNVAELLGNKIRSGAILAAVAAAVALGVTVLELPPGLVVVAAVAGVGSLFLGRTRVLLIAFFALLLVVLPFVVTDQYWLRVTVTIAIYAILALGLNVIVGYAGVLDLGFIAFYGIGAYTAALLMLKCGWSFWAALPVATAAGALLGVLRGLPTLRLSGDYLAIVTLGFGEIVRMTFTNWVGLTNGPMGLRGIEAPSIGSFSFGFDAAHGGYMRYYFLVLALLGLAVYVVYRLRYSRPGRALLAIRDNETAAAAMGVHLTRYKALAYAVGAAFGGAAGAFFVSFNLFVSPNSFLFFESAIVLCMVVVGGMGAIAGAIVGAVILGSFPELLRFLADFRYLIFGALMVAVAIFRPRGLLKA
ncbi:MAG: branched-chain amino acid ABC transporter permease [Candidatus Zixiibacteriota bacterium]|jgi:branched-chain amino acid transport system permease protein